MKIFKINLTKVNKKQCMEFGQVATLATLYFALHYKSNDLVFTAMIVILITIVLPIIFYPFAFLWFGLSGLMSKISPVIILSVIYFLIVVPVGLIRRLLGKDSMQLRQFKKDKASVMINREHLHTAADLLHTF
jgi:uncharacterized membrane protein